ncbi:MAG: dihydroorotase [Candidatus Omnitrophica bacterium]|nr:dihydroorotase [Candidatus Omnitrophota bacterium]MCM8809168.1 dihydroorotase [Candidatus Omnitrophota bacterium]MCM8811060.1 dihydroorotase [Candidatus Omnitrophota bacterium]
MGILLKNGYLIEPKSGKEGEFDILIEDGVVKEIKKNIFTRNYKIIDCKNKIVSPGFVDLHCHLREPGREDEETIYTGSLSAVSGGFTTICCMPNTDPPLDNKVSVRFVYEKGEKSLCEVLPIGAITKDRKGKELAPYFEMIEENTIAFSDDGNCVMDSNVMRRALEYTLLHKKPIISHSEDENLARNGVMNEGFTSTKMGLPGIPAEAEEIMVERDLRIAKLTGGILHITHLSCMGSVESIRRFKKILKNISCDVTAHHLILTEDAISGYNTNAKVSPPLRTEKDRISLIEGLKDGTIDCIITDHAPHSYEEKQSGFENAPFGIIGFETFLPLCLKLVDYGIKLKDILYKITYSPSKILNLERGIIEKGKRADIVVFDPDIEWVYKEDKIKSKSKNTPFLNWKLKGKVLLTISKGKIVYKEKEFID